MFLTPTVSPTLSLSLSTLFSYLIIIITKYKAASLLLISLWGLATFERGVWSASLRRLVGIFERVVWSASLRRLVGISQRGVWLVYRSCALIMTLWYTVLMQF